MVEDEKDHLTVDGNKLRSEEYRQQQCDNRNGCKFQCSICHKHSELSIQLQTLLILRKFIGQ